MEGLRGSIGGRASQGGRRLSAVSEGITVSRRLYLTFIGPGAYTCCESLEEKATQVFGALQQQRAEDAFRAITSRPSVGGEAFKRVASLQSRATVTSVLQADFGMHSAIVVLDFKGGPQPLPGYGTGQAQKRSMLISMSNLSSLESITQSCQSMGSAATLDSDAEDERETTRQCVKMFFHPVEYFSQEVPPCASLDQWRHTCLLFLIDPRLEGAEQKDQMSDLERRLTEADRLIAKFVKKFEVARAMPLLGVILLHDTSAPAAEETAASEVPSGCRSDEVSSVSGFELLSDMEQPASSPDAEATTEPPSPIGGVASPRKPSWLRDGDYGLKDDCGSSGEGMNGLTPSPSRPSSTGSAAAGLTGTAPPQWTPPVPARDFSSAAAKSPPMPEAFQKFVTRMRKITRAKADEPTHFTCNFENHEELLQCLLQITATAESLRKHDAHALYEPELSADLNMFSKSKRWRCELL